MHSYLPLILFLSISTIQIVSGQNTSDEVNLLQPNLAKMEWLIYESVNKLREEKGLPDLVWDAVLYRAAKDHADYLIKEKKLSHSQTVTGKKTPAHRVKVHGGLMYTAIGENVAAIPLGVQLPVKGIKRSTVTYKGSATTMAAVWKASPRHYKNLLSKQYNCTALATSYDHTTQRLVGVQVFGYSNTPSTLASLPDYSDQLLSLPQPRLPYHLKKYRYKSKNRKVVTSFLKIKMDRGYITSSYKNAKKSFKGRRSGIVQEFLPLSQFDSASTKFISVPNRRNGLYELNGELTHKPVYRRKLLRYARKNTPRDYYIYTRLLRIKKPPTLFIYPMYPGGTEEDFNLFLVKNNRLEAFKPHINIPGELFDVAFPELDFSNSFKSLEVKERFTLRQTYDTLELQIFYPPQQVIIDSKKQDEVKSAFNRIRGKIIAVEAAAFASIEGDQSLNDRLARDRMDYFMILVKPFLDTIAVQPHLVTLEQENLFYQQIEGTRLQHLKQMNPDEVRHFVNQNKKDTLLSRLLNEQRYTKIKLIWRQDFKEYLAPISAAQKYESLKNEFEKYKKPKQNLLTALEKAQLARYHELAQSTNPGSALPEVPDQKQYPVFRYHQLIYQYTVLQNIDDETLYDSLHVWGKSKYFPGRLKPQLVYNNLVLIYRKFINNQLKDVMDYENIDCAKFRQSEFHLKKFKKLKCKNTLPPLTLEEDYFILKEIPALIALGKSQKVNNFPVEELWKYYYVNTINSLYNNIPLPAQIFSMLPGFKEHLHPDDAILDDAERLKLAYFYCALYRYNTARGLLEPIANRPNPDTEALKLYVTLKYEDYKDPHDYAKFLISEFPRLGKIEWCDLWSNPRYMNFLQFEDLLLKKFYNCNCDR